jgi:hypothetical protein
MDRQLDVSKVLAIWIARCWLAVGMRRRAWVDDGMPIEREAGVAYDL